MKKGELKILKGKDQRQKGRCKKLDLNMDRDFKILLTSHNNWFCILESPATWTIHSTFNINWSTRYRRLNAGREVIPIQADDLGCRMGNIIPTGPPDDNSIKNVYVSYWEQCSHYADKWETFHNVNENARECLHEYYAQYANMEMGNRFEKKKPR